MPILIGVLYTLYVIKLGGDFMHARMFLPALFCFLLPVAMLPASAEASPVGMRAAIVTAGAAIALWAVVVASSVRVDRENEHGIGDERGWYARMAGVDNPVRVEDYAKFAFYTEGKRLHDLAKNDARWVLIDDASAGRLNPAQRRMHLTRDVLPQSTHVVVLRGALGILGFAAGPAVHVVDLHGLSDPIAARLEIAARGRPGHEKRLSNYWLVARYAAPTDKDDLRVVAARDALACGPLAELTAAVSGPISAGRFLRNLGASFRLQSLRLPPDPYAAKAELCAPGL
jgi:arabinofuranosyltransferase